MRYVSFPVLCALLAVLVWGTTAAVLNIIVSTISGLFLIALSSSIAFLGLLLFILITNRFLLVREYFANHLYALLFAGFLGTFLSNWFFVEAVARLPAQEAAILYYLWPIFVIVFSMIGLKTPLSVRQLLGLLVSFAGVILVITRGDIFSLAFSNFSGILLAVASAGSYGLFLFFTKKDHVDPIVGSFFYYGVASLASFALIFFTQSPLHWPSVHWLGILWIGLGVSVLGLVSWMTALQKGDSTRISTIGFLIPFVSLIYIYFLVGEPIQLASVAGLCLVMVGIFLQPRT